MSVVGRLLNRADRERAAVMFGAGPEVGQAAPARPFPDADAVVSDLEDERIRGRLHGHINAAGLGVASDVGQCFAQRRDEIIDGRVRRREIDRPGEGNPWFEAENRLEL